MGRTSGGLVPVPPARPHNLGVAEHHRPGSHLQRLRPSAARSSKFDARPQKVPSSFGADVPYFPHGHLDRERRNILAHRRARAQTFKGHGVSNSIPGEGQVHLEENDTREGPGFVPADGQTLSNSTEIRK